MKYAIIPIIFAISMLTWIFWFFGFFGGRAVVRKEMDLKRGTNELYIRIYKNGESVSSGIWWDLTEAQTDSVIAKYKQ